MASGVPSCGTCTWCLPNTVEGSLPNVRNREGDSHLPLVFFSWHRSTNVLGPSERSNSKGEQASMREHQCCASSFQCRCSATCLPATGLTRHRPKVVFHNRS